MPQRDSKLESRNGYALAFPDAEISITDYLHELPAEEKASHPPVSVEHCEVGDEDGESVWTFERVGPFHSRGASWHSAGWRDAGRFGAALAEPTAGPLSVSAYGFRPVAADGTPIGLPPVHIHHMHVTSSQSLARQWLRRSSDGFGLYAVEFDLHGDRQCASSSGGMNCTVRAFPAGYGMHITDPMETFFDLADVRPAGSPPLTFYAEHAYRWTRAPRRRVGKLLTMISTGTFKPHDDYLLHFDAARPSEYLYWQEGRWPANVSLVHLYWHTHHAYVDDLWAVSAGAASLRLRQLFGGMFSNLTALGLDVRSAQRLILAQLSRAQSECVACASPPLLRCSLDPDRWEAVEGDAARSHYSRYRAPHCPEWDVVAGEPFTLLAFHKLQPQGALQARGVSQHYWMHSGLYGLYVGKDAAQPIPHGMYYEDLMLGGSSHPLDKPERGGKQAGWWKPTWGGKHY